MSGGTTTRDVVGRLVRESPTAFVFMALAGLCALVPGLAIPLLIRAFMDEYLINGATEWGVPIVLALTAAGVLAGLLSWAQFRVLGRFSVRLSATGSTAYVWHALRIPVPTVDSLGPADVTARAAGLQRLAFQAGTLFPLASVKAVTLVVYCVVLLVLDVRLGLSAIAVIVVSIVASSILLRRRDVRQQESDRGRVAQSALTSELIDSIETIKASASEQWVFDRWCRERDSVGREVSRLGRSSQRLGMVGPLTQTFGLGVVLAVGSWLVLTGALSLGTLVASQALLVQVLVYAGELVWFGVLLQGVVSAESQAAVVRDVDLDPEVRGASRAAGPDLGDRPVGVSVRALTFGYERDAPPLLDGIDLDVPAGSRVALVGGSGSGKSTLVRLVIGELQPWSGSVFLDGVPRLEVPRDQRTAAVAYVPQVPVLVPGTIRDNLTMFDGSVSDEAVLAAIRDACIEEAVRSRPRGLEEPVSGSTDGFSGGELQRLAIARALVGDPRLLVLDEATSALDPVVEEEVEQNLRRRSCTCLVVAHRLSTVRDADRILVLDAGRIVQQGAYESLRTSGQFAELVHG